MAQIGNAGYRNAPHALGLSLHRLGSGAPFWRLGAVEFAQESASKDLGRGAAPRIRELSDLFGLFREQPDTDDVGATWLGGLRRRIGG